MKPECHCIRDYMDQKNVPWACFPEKEDCQWKDRKILVEEKQS